MPLRPAGAVFALAIAVGAAAADTRPRGTARIVERHADWSVVVAETDRGKHCYAAAQPRTRRPEGAVRGPAFVFVTTRPTDQVRDEFSVEFGFEVAAGAELTVGDETYPLAGDTVGAWIREIADETRLVAAMRTHPQMSLQSTSLLGERTVDTYALEGFAEALARARRECADPNTTS